MLTLKDVSPGLPSLVIFGTHWCIDAWHCEMKNTDSNEKELRRYFYTDQLAHFAVLAGMAFFAYV